MKKIIAIIMCLFLMACVLCGCIRYDVRQETDNAEITIYVDKETGVNYYIYCGVYKGGITVRVNADGTPYVSEVKR